MIYAGVFLFFLTIASGLCAFSGMLGTQGAHIAQTVFFSSQLLASLSFKSVFTSVLNLETDWHRCQG